MMRRARWIYPALVCVMIALYYAIPSARVAIVAFVGVLSVAVVACATAVRRPLRPIAWLLVAVGLLLVAAGELCYNIAANGDHMDAFPSSADWLYIAAYVPSAVGLLWLGLDRTPIHDWSGAIETAALSLAGSLIIWITLVRPTVNSMELTGIGKTVAVAGWVGDVVILVSALRLVTVWRRNLSAAFLAIAVLAFFLGNVRYGIDLRNGTWLSGGPVDAGIMAFFGLSGAAALMPDMIKIGPTRPVKHHLGFAGLISLAVALLVGPTILLVEATSGPVQTAVAVAIVMAAVGLLAVGRLAVAIAGHRRALARDAVLRRVTRQLGLAVSARDVTGSLSSALAAMTGDETCRVDLVDVDLVDVVTPDTVTRADSRLTVPVRVSIEEVEGELTDPARSFVYTAPPDELAELEDVLVTLADQAGVALQRIDLAERVRASEKAQDVLLYRASHDGLTGLANAELFRDELRTASRTVAPGRLSAVLFIDLDDFKSINDTLGHEAGDAMLVVAAQRIRACLRHDDLGARLGGDEFAVLLRDLADEAAAYVVARRLTEALAQPTMMSGFPVVSRASVGLAIASTWSDYNVLLRRADAALYAAKAAGKGRWRPYDSSMQSPLRRGNDLRTELERVLDADAGSMSTGSKRAGTSAASNGLTMHYQPIVELAPDAVVGFEALIRWTHPSRGAISVPELISVAEQTGLIVPLGDWVLRRALSDAIEIVPATRSGVAPYISVNISVAQMRSPGFGDHIRKQLVASELDPARLVMEITESQLVADDEQIWDDLGELRKMGVRVAIDDYGTGYASLSYLRHPVIDIVKLDRRFMQNIAADRSRMLVRAVLGLTHELGLPLIAEGIEDEATRDVLVELGCEFGQGHLFAAAMPLEQARNWIELEPGAR